MKKGVVLNTQISAVIADMGHFDTLSIGDAGMPVPNGTKKIDLAVQKGLPSFIDVLKNVLSELQIQKVYLAEEIKTQNPEQLANIKKLIDVPIEFIPHDEMKKRLSNDKAFIRTGEASPFSNIILESGVTF
ncbi:D-ribose pyranase [Companilactobacillus sp. HBUAS56275]|uniref:D-ribose pyranase n=1 Tax=Candidatus Companilactobacillus pullicola TaxID=2838523 RepID=A0A9D1ZPW0_9LACO|nr:D-ribose pyranase [Candidatus Companilactobacillus pullicola]